MALSRGSQSAMGVPFPGHRLGLSWQPALTTALHPSAEVLEMAKEVTVTNRCRALTTPPSVMDSCHLFIQQSEQQLFQVVSNTKFPPREAYCNPVSSSLDK